MPNSGRNPRLNVQTKVLIPVLAFLVLVPVSMVWIVNAQFNGQMRAAAARELATAQTIFQQALDSRRRDLLTQATNALSESRYQALAFVVSDPPSQAAEKTIHDFEEERLQDYGDDCTGMYFTYNPESYPNVAPIGFRRGQLNFSLDEMFKAAGPINRQALEGDPASGMVSLGAGTFFVSSVPVASKKADRAIAGTLTICVRLAESAVAEMAKRTHTQILLFADRHLIASTLTGVDSESLRELIGIKPVEGSAAAPVEPVLVNGEHFLPSSGSYEEGGLQRGFRYVLLSSFETTFRAQADTLRTLILITVAGFILSAAVVWFFVRRVIQPLRELRDTAEAVGRGDFSRKISRFSNDECGDLAEAFNRMTTNLQGSRAELEKAMQSLSNTQAQLIQSEKLSAVGQFVAGVAHELNNPLTAVIGFSDLLSKTGNDPEIKPHLELIAKSAQRCHKIVQNLLSFARQHPPERSLTQVNRTIDEVLEIMAYDLRTSNIKVVKEFQEDLPKIMADPHQLQQVFVNIVGNARQAIQTFRPDGKITARTRVDGSSIRIEFTDNGPGIRPENLSRIFDPFFTTKAVGKGTGLGLSLTYGIIQEHHGRIWAESELGNGARFVIELPIAAEAAPAQPEKSAAPARLAPARASASGKAVLVVDDEQWILTLARQLLTRGGHTVDAVLGAEQAIEALRSRNYDVIVCDWKMPGMNGIQFYEHLLSSSPIMTGRVLFMSGDIINETFQEFLNRHKKTCLAKPFAIEEFQSAVERMLN